MTETLNERVGVSSVFYGRRNSRSTNLSWSKLLANVTIFNVFPLGI